MLNAYEILGVTKSASSAQVKKAWRKLSQKFHPDRNRERGAEEKFKLVQEAYDFITTGVARTSNFKEPPAPPPQPQPRPRPQPQPTSTHFNVGRLTLDVSFALLFKRGSLLQIPNTEFCVRIPDGLHDGYAERTTAFHIRDNTRTMVFDVTYKLYDPSGLYTLKVIDGPQPRLYCEIQATIAELLAEVTRYVRNVDPNEPDVAVRLDPTRSLAVITGAGLPRIGDSRGPLYVKILPLFKPLTGEQLPTLRALKEKIDGKLSPPRPRYAY